jgi:hypothetical protein
MKTYGDQRMREMIGDGMLIGLAAGILIAGIVTAIILFATIVMYPTPWPPGTHDDYTPFIMLGP